MYMLLKHIVYQLAHHLILFIVQHYEFEKGSIPQEQKVKFAKKLAEFGMSFAMSGFFRKKKSYVYCKFIFTSFVSAMCS